jgi:hypothetical protein
MVTHISPAIRLGGVVILAAAIAACSSPAGSAQPATSPPAASTASASAAPSDAPPTSPSPENTPAASVVIPSLVASTPLIDVLPAEVGGEPTQKLALVGSDLSTIDSSASMIFVSVINLLKVNDADMTIGVASNSKSSIIAIRVKGKTAQQIADAMFAARTLNATTTKDELDLGGKHVLKVSTTIATVPFYLYQTSDVSFTIAGTDESVVAEALSKLP